MCFLKPQAQQCNRRLGTNLKLHTQADAACPSGLCPTGPVLGLYGVYVPHGAYTCVPYNEGTLHGE